MGDLICCSGSLRIVTKIIAAIYMILAIGGCIICLALAGWQLSWGLFWVLVEFSVSLCLYFGASQKHAGWTFPWFVYNIIITICVDIGIVYVIYGIYAPRARGMVDLDFQTFQGQAAKYVIAAVVVAIGMTYSLIVVYKLQGKLIADERTRHQNRQTSAGAACPGASA